MSRRSQAARGDRALLRPSYRILWITFAGLATAILFFSLLALTDWFTVIAWLVAINLTTFAIFGIDKALAKAGQLRIPEVVLHLFTLLGGFLGQLAGRFVFHHKTNFRKHPSFTIVPIASFLLWISIGYIVYF